MSPDESTDNSVPIFSLPAEIFPLIASHLPLQSFPATLSALVLTSSRIHAYVKRILYSKVIISNAEHASQVLERISKDRELGSLIQELHLLMDYSIEAVKKRSGKTVLVKLHEVVGEGFLPNIGYLRLVLLHPKWHSYTEELDHFPRRFWTDLKTYCPRLNGLSLDGVWDTSEDPWVNESDFYELREFLDLTSLGIKLQSKRGIVYPRHLKSLFRNLVNLTSLLQSLTISINSYELPRVAPLLSITFPHLKSFDVTSVYLDNTEDAMDFWTRHPGLGKLSISSPHRGKPWFSDDIETNLLPKLTHLKANFGDVRACARFLGQLQHLSITSSYNAQIPYLLRSVLPEGLPGLKSLEIDQEGTRSFSECSQEGGMWSETESGDVRHAAHCGNACRTMDRSGYMYSIMRGAPNLEELCLHGDPLTLKGIIHICPALSGLKRLERLYYHGCLTNEKSQVVEFLSEYSLIAHACDSLKSVTDVNLTKFGSYIKGKVVRDHVGSVVDVVPGYGFGMEFKGGNDDPFPMHNSSHW